MAVAGKARRVCRHKRDSIEFRWPSCPPPRGQPPVEGQAGWLVRLRPVRVRAGEPAELALIAHGTSVAVRRAATARTARNLDEASHRRYGHSARCPTRRTLR
jgi:hypothetical protein